MGPASTSRRSLMLAALLASALSGAARAQTSAPASAQVSAAISAPASISVSRNLSFSITPQTLASGLVIRSSALNAVNAIITGSQAASLSIPATFSVSRRGGRGSLTVRTVGRVTSLLGPGGSPLTGLVQGDLLSQPVLVTGSLDDGVLSFAIGAEVTLASDVAPGEYQGVLTVIAQYN